MAPLLTSHQVDYPSWCELRTYAIRSIGADSSLEWLAKHPANKLVVFDGACRLRSQSGATRNVPVGGSVDVQPGGHLIMASASPSVVVLLGGRWGEPIGGVGLFSVSTVGNVADAGDPFDYRKTTGFDRHYHDCDEYWIFVAGGGTVYSEGLRYDARPGDCIATRAGHHHDFAEAHGDARGVYFETTLHGQKRRGHLWEHRHGPAVPAVDLDDPEVQEWAPPPSVQ